MGSDLANAVDAIRDQSDLSLGRPVLDLLVGGRSGKGDLAVDVLIGFSRFVDELVDGGVEVVRDGFGRRWLLG